MHNKIIIRFNSKQMTEGHYESKTNYAQIQFTTVDDLLRKVVITFDRFFFPEKHL